jgi:peptidoglycan/xylan/chitin deacetylase (PgdA/CDA1 family)
LSPRLAAVTLAALSASAVALAIAAPTPTPEAPETLRIAVTIDDLPWLGAVPADGKVAATDRLLGSLQEHGVPAVGLVTCNNRVEGVDLLQRWLDAGMELGNHSYSHHDLQKHDPDAWLDDIRRCDDELETLLGKRPRWFRYPYLHIGPDEATRDRVLSVLTGALGYGIARVSVDNHEWKLAELYGRALTAGDVPLQTELKQAYVAHMVDAVRNFRQVARDKVGRDVAHVLLLHSNALAADHFGAVLTALEAEGAAWITLDEALADPVYARPDQHWGKWGISWLYRIAPKHEERPWDDRTWQELKDRFADRLPK